MSGEKSNHKKRTAQADSEQNRIDDGLFVDRVRKIAGRRALTPWLKSIGWIPNDVTRINAGVVPGSTKLLQLASAENVNINWLLTGLGQRHVTEHWLTDASLSRRIDEMLKNSRSARVLDVQCSRTTRRAVVIEALQSYRDHACFVVLCGPFGTLSDAALLRHSARISQHQTAAVDPNVYTAIVEGRMRRTELIDPFAGICLAEATAPPSESREPDPVSIRDQLHEHIERLTDQQVHHLLGLLTAPHPPD